MWNLETLQKFHKKNILHDLPVASGWSASQLNQFFQQEFPHRKQEEWKYTNFNALKQQTFTWLGENNIDIDITPYDIKDTYQIVFVNGHWHLGLTKLLNMPQDVKITTIKEAAAKAEFLTILEKNQTQQTIFSKLNAGLMSDGLFIYIPAGVKLQQPIHLLYLNTNNAQPHMSHPRHLIYLDQFAQATVFEQYVGVDNAVYFNNVVTQILMKEHAQLTHYKLQRESQNAFHIADIYINQQRHSSVKTVHISWGAQLDRENLCYDLQGEAAECSAFGFNFAKQQQILDTHSQIQHQASYTKSQQIYKTIAKDKAHSIFNGKVLVAANTQRVFAEQFNPNLLLSNTAEINSKPELQIYADDVRCTHGATVGELDEEALFYMQSRGIAYETAAEILIEGFANEIIEQIQHQEFQRIFKL